MSGLDMLKEKPMVLAALVVLVILVVIYFVWYHNKERFTQFTMDMASERHPDPVLFKYTGRLRDPNGMDGYDYYYNNKALWRQGIAKHLTGLKAFEPRVDIPHPRVIPRSQYGLERGDMQNIFRNSELTWGKARDMLKREHPGVATTRNEIEARAAEAERTAAAAAVGNKAAMAQADAPGMDQHSERFQACV